MQKMGLLRPIEVTYDHSEIQEIFSSREISVFMARGNLRHKLLKLGLLNIIVYFFDAKNSMNPSISEIEKLQAGIKFQPRMKNFNASAVVGIDRYEYCYEVQHWDGFRTKFTLNFSEIIAQEFTK